MPIFNRFRFEMIFIKTELGFFNGLSSFCPKKARIGPFPQSPKSSLCENIENIEKIFKVFRVSTDFAAAWREAASWHFLW